MRYVLLLTICIILAVPQQSLSQNSAGKRFSAGVIIGEPTGLSAKYSLSTDNAIDGALAWSIYNDWIYVHTDYLFVQYPFSVERGAVPVYLGPGLSVSAGDGEGWGGVRFAGGIGYEFDTIPLEAFFELAPAVGILPEMDFRLQGGLGIRYCF